MPDLPAPWVDVVAEASVDGPPWTAHQVRGAEVVLVRDAAGDVHAVGNRCPHLDAPMTSAEVEGGTVACPRHWYSFSLVDGHNVAPGWDDCRLAVHPCRVVDGRVQVAPEEPT